MRPDPHLCGAAHPAARLPVRLMLLVLLVGMPVFAQVFLPARRIMPSLSSSETIPPPLDIVTNPPWSAYSVTRKLWSGWTGSAYRVYRSSDGLSNDIGFTASGAVDTNALISFVGANSGWARTIYDQSGNLRHLDRSTLTNVVLVATNGTVVTDINDYPSGFVRAAVVHNYLDNGVASPSSLSNTSFLVSSPLATMGGTTVPTPLVNLGSALQNGVNLYGVRLDLINDGAAASGVTSAPVVLGHKYLGAALFRSNNSEVVQINFDATDNTASGESGSLVSAGITIGLNNPSHTSASQFFNEWIVYNTETDTNSWSLLSQNMTNYYGISYPSVVMTNTAFFDGANDYIGLTSSGPTGLADGKSFTVSFWMFCWMGTDGQELFICSFGKSTSPGLNVRRSTGNKIQIYGFSATPTLILNLITTSSVTSASGWTHILAVIDMTSAANTKIYINGSDEILTTETVTNDNLDVVGTSYVYRVGSYVDNSTKMNGAICQFWCDDVLNDVISDYYDNGFVNLGASGSNPTGSSPVFYFIGYGAGFNVNGGTGGNFTTTGNPGAMWPPGVTP